MVVAAALAEERPPKPMFIPTMPPTEVYGSALVLNPKYMDMFHEPKMAEEELESHPDFDEEELDKYRVEENWNIRHLGLNQASAGAKARTGTGRELAKIGQAERAVMKELKGAPKLMREELDDLQQVADLTLRASQLKPKPHSFRRTALLEQGAHKSQSMSTARLASEGRKALRTYAAGLARLSREDKSSVNGLEHARDLVAAAFEKEGLSSNLEDKVDAELSKAESAGRQLLSHEKRAAKSAIQEART